MVGFRVFRSAEMVHSSSISKRLMSMQRVTLPKYLDLQSITVMKMPCKLTFHIRTSAISLGRRVLIFSRKKVPDYIHP
uniref:Uncharacterized protein n=1 Tax=Arundo donax TaxID=35708 RepID=A0A0A8ZH51_ARUDO